MNEQLKQALKQEDTILFIGSGISCWSGLPSWTGLLNQLADLLQSTARDATLVRKEIKQDLLQAASYGFDQLTPYEIGNFIRSACQPGLATPHEVHCKIVSLGPRCFITTNYDQLLEESLRKWKHGRPFRVVTNKQPFEEADIIQARALDFIFKPHGDVGDIDSIVLTREQYRKLFEGGEWRHALESLKTLLITRRVVYLGFGLRDPDFLLLRDVLVNTWKKGMRDHYAIMADVSSGEISYWRKNHGIHLVGYSTKELSNGKRDHSKLLDLLDECLQPIVPAAATAAATHAHSEVILSLLRYASGMMRFDSAHPELPLRVHSNKSWGSAHIGFLSTDRWNNTEAKTFLKNGPQRAVLLGLPGAGKTYGFRQAVSQLAQNLHDSCLAQSPALNDLIIPMIAEMKLYKGDLVALLETTIPTGISFGDLASRFRIRLFLDSFNEMPREQWERGAHEMDIPTFLKTYPTVEIIIGSRTDDGLAKLDFPCYRLDEIDQDFLERWLKEQGITIAGRFNHELIDLLSKPFYFQLVASRGVKLPEQPHPRDIYYSFFSNLTVAFTERFNSSLDLVKALASFAYESISKGEEALPVQSLYQSLNKEMQSLGMSQPTPEAVGHWLVSKSLLLPYSGGRVALFHQSVTEFLAANELARRFQATPIILKEKLTWSRWDQAILLTLSILPEGEAESFLKAVMNADFILALRATKYLEVNRESIVGRLLTEIPERIKQPRIQDFEIAWVLEQHVPATEANEVQLNAIMKCGGTVGGAAAAKLLNCKGRVMKDAMIVSLLRKRADYNYCSRLGRALQEFLEKDDLTKIAKMADSIDGEMANDIENSRAHGFVDGASEALAKVKLSAIVEAIIPKDHIPSCSKARIQIVLQCLRNRHSTEALSLAAEILLKGFKDAAVTIHFIAEHGPKDCHLSWTSFSKEHVSFLINLLGDKGDEPWALPALGSLCKRRPDLATYVAEHAQKASGLRRAALFYSLGTNCGDSIFMALENFFCMKPAERKREPEYLLSQMDLNWVGNEDLFFRLLKLRNTHLAWCLIEKLIYGKGKLNISKLNIGDITWWLDWLGDKKNPETQWWFNNRFSKFLAENASMETQTMFLAEFNKNTSKYRSILAETILNARTDLTTDDFSEDALTFLTKDLSRRKLDEFHGSLLGRTATETFITERLIPMLAGAGKFLRRNLEMVLEEAGSRHRRRYLNS